MTVEIDGANNIVKTNTISEVTSANGVTVDGLNIKDSKLVTANSVITTNITDANVTTAKITDANVTQGKIADQAINEAKMQISNAPVNGYMLTSQSGASGGMTWAAAPSASIFGAVGFTARLTTGANLNDNTTTVIIFNDEIYDTNSAYNVSDGIFTVPVAGRYLFGVTLQFADSNGNMSDMHGYLSINDGTSDIQRAESTSDATTFTKNTITWTGIVAALSVNDTVKIKARIDTNNGSGAAVLHGDNKSIFWGVNIA